MKRILTALALCSSLATAQVSFISYYTFSQYSTSYTPVTGTTVFTGTTDDTLSATIPLGFSFVYGSSTFTNIKVCSNGWITFDTTATTGTNYTAISGTVPNIIAPFARDLQGNAAGNVQTLLSGTPGSQIFTIQWTDYRKYFAGVGVDNFNFQINLYEGTNFVEFVYGSMTTTVATGDTCQVGLKGAATATDFQNRQITYPTHTWATSIGGATNAASCDFRSTNLPASGDAFLFTPPPPAFLSVIPTVLPAAVSSGGIVTIQAVVAEIPTGTPVGSIVTTIDLTNVGGFPGTPMNDLGGGLFEIMTPVSGGNGPQACLINATDGVLSGFATASVVITPSNDECVGALAVGVGVNGPFDNTGATNSAGTAATCGLGGNKNDVWYSFTAICPGLHTVTTGCAGFDSVVSVWSACGGTEIACNDDNPTAGCGIGGSLTTFTAVVGNTYLIRVASYNQTVTSTFTLTITSGGGGLNLAFSAPLGAGSIQADIINGQPFGGYLFAVTFTPGTFPNGWLGGLDIPFSDLLNLINAGFPFVGPLGACGEFTIGPFGGLPSGLSIWGAAVGTTFPLGAVTGVAPASTFTIP